jgi:hypothetical protein
MSIFSCFCVAAVVVVGGGVVVVDVVISNKLRRMNDI